MAALQFNLLSPCTSGEATITVPAFMRLDQRKCAILFACVWLLLICSCEKHRVGEMPDAQKEHVDLAAQSTKTSSAPSERSTSPSPAPTLTPAEFFPGTKPR